MDISKARNYLLKESKEIALDEMAKIKGELKAAIERVIRENPDVEGLALKKIIRADQGVIDGLMGDDLYDNQLNKFIALTRGDRVLQQRGRKPLPASDKPTPSKSIFKKEPTDEPEIEPSELETPEGSSDPVAANNFRNIILKKVKKIEALDDFEKEGSIDMQALKQFIKRPNVVQALGREDIANLVSPIIDY
jgi:hypothetical protein